ncbi:MAG: hypothetical protein EBR05_05005 [Marivivens sp.]|jgi:methyl-accepting chemotaxis protein|nr:hypothetical protein [Marivivens geojensis]NBQ49781.1 hypothetical protein [Marivivens sp.]NBT50665.1 hypothetical protein [Marivivens sp.]NBX09175.1 hypothetical protein [Marivivens sp.]NCW68033.1 hypothetical protein [Marivivens sp.]
MTHFTPIQSPIRATIDHFVRLRSEIETTFVSASASLEGALDRLGHLSTVFAELREGLGAETEAQLSALIDTVNAHLSTLQANCGSFTTASSELHKSVRLISSEVHELDRVVRTIANISINARIQGNSLVPARPQVTAFIDRLAAMSEESENILSEINDSMAEIAYDVRAMDYEQRLMLGELRQNVMPSIAAFSTMSTKIRDGQAGMVSAAQDMDEQANQIASEVGRIIVALQTGDSARQRIERVEETLAIAETVDGRDASRLADLAIALSERMKLRTQDDIQTAIASLRAVQERGEQAILAASRTTLGGSGLSSTAGGKEHKKLEQSLRGNGEHFAAMKGRAESVHNRLAVILKHEATLRGIAHQIRLSGINAVIICAKLGTEGRALRELAHWLRDLTDESDLIIARLQSILADTRETIRVLTEDRIGGLESCLSDFSNDGQSLFNMIETANGLMVRTSSGFDATASSLPIQIASATGELERFSERLDRLGSHLMGLQLFKDTVADQGASDPDRMTDILSSLRTKYTMEGERIIHDELFGGDVVALDAVANAAPDAGSDDLDDILF